MGYALITGGTSGIGFELARNFLKDGYSIIIVSSNNDRLKNAKEKLENEYKTIVLTYEQNMEKPRAAEQLYSWTKANKYDISILVNNAGIGLVGPTEKINLMKDENMITLDVINLVKLCKLYIADMYNCGNGKILNVASTGAFQPGPYTSTYYGSKAFVLSYSRAIRYEAMKRGVQVCTLCPGATKTEFFDREGVKAPKGAMSAELVAKYAYKQFMRNKEVIIPGLANRILKLFPVRLRMMYIANIKKKKC